jgi:hypothetical protein
MLILLWSLTLLGLACWTLAAWAAHALLSAELGWVGAAGDAAAQGALAPWLDLWWPGWQDALRLALELLQSTLAWTQAAAPWLVWGVWGLGSLLTLAGAALASLLIVKLRPAGQPAAA